jgi:hypothetical protein
MEVGIGMISRSGGGMVDALLDLGIVDLKVTVGLDSTTIFDSR